LQHSLWRGGKKYQIIAKPNRARDVKIRAMALSNKTVRHHFAIDKPIISNKLTVLPRIGIIIAKGDL
jgi:hypothetical protein